MATLTSQWTESDLIILLSRLNFHIEEIRSITKVDGKVGLRNACEKISHAIGGGCTWQRVERKIKQLWATCGNPNGDKDPYDLCLYGIVPKTLPGVSREIFSRVSSRMEEMNRHNHRANSHEPASSAPVRRSRRMVSRSGNGSLIVCRCGFTHAIPLVPCDQCATQQHVYCYYEVEDVSLDSHICDDCKKNDEIVVGSNIGQLEARLERSQEQRVQDDQEVALPLGPFEIPVEEEIMWGPGDDEIQDYLTIILGYLQNVATSLEPGSQLSMANVSGVDNPDTSLLVQAALGSGPECWLYPEIRNPGVYRHKRCHMFRSILAAAIGMWVFAPYVPDHSTLSYDSVLLIHYQKEVLGKHSMRTLSGLHRRAMVEMMKKKSVLQEVITKQAEGLADRCLEAVLPLTNLAESRSKSNAKDWVSGHGAGLQRRRELIEAFKYALKLMRWLPLNQKCYQLYLPMCKCIPPLGWAVLLNETSLQPDKAVKQCIMAGVIEYPFELFFPNKSGLDTLSGPQNIISPSPEQSKYGRVIVPAIVTILEEEDGPF